MDLATKIFGSKKYTTYADGRSEEQQLEPNIVQRVGSAISNLSSKIFPNQQPKRVGISPPANAVKTNSGGYSNLIAPPTQLKVAGPTYNPAMKQQQQAPAMAGKVPQAVVQTNNQSLNAAISQYFGDQATNALRTLQGENSRHDPRAENRNRDGSLDRGIFQINSNTFADFQRRKANVMQQYGINSYDDMYDPVKNTIMAKIIWDEQGWNAWYGAPQDLRTR